jgi:hypothetical protein
MTKRLQVFLAAIILATIMGGGTAMAQNSDDDLQKQIDQLKKEKEKLDAEKAKLDAEKALADTQKALEQAKDPSAQQVADLQKAKALADAQKALAESQKALQQTQDASSQKATELQTQKAIADAQKALADAQTQATIARYIGDVKAGPYSGAVDMKEKAGTEEASLLSARAVKEGATKIATAVQGEAQTFYIFGAKEFPTFQRLLTFRFRKELIKQAFEAAGVTKPVGAVREAVTPGMVSAGLDAFSKLLGYFKTDYTLGGVETKLDESLLLFSVAGRLRGKEVHLPLIYEPNSQGSAVAAVTKELADLVDLRKRAADQASKLKDEIANTEKKAADPQNAAIKDALLATAAALKPRLDQLNGVIALYDSFAGSLTSPEASTGAVPLNALAQEFAIEAALKDGAAVLLLRLENTGGGYLLKKNLLTGLWKMPLYHMGGATVTYLLLSGSDGKVIAGDVIPIYGGFVKTDSLRDALSK